MNLNIAVAKTGPQFAINQAHVVDKTSQRALFYNIPEPVQRKQSSTKNFYNLV